MKYLITVIRPNQEKESTLLNYKSLKKISEYFEFEKGDVVQVFSFNSISENFDILEKEYVI